jgi:hypothetical protein
MASAEGGPLAQRGASFQLAKNLKQGELRATLKKSVKIRVNPWLILMLNHYEKRTYDKNL